MKDEETLMSEVSHLLGVVNPPKSPVPKGKQNQPRSETATRAIAAQKDDLEKDVKISKDLIGNLIDISECKVSTEFTKDNEKYLSKYRVNAVLSNPFDTKLLKFNSYRHEGKIKKSFGMNVTTFRMIEEYAYINENNKNSFYVCACSLKGDNVTAIGLCSAEDLVKTVNNTIDLSEKSEISVITIKWEYFKSNDLIVYPKEIKNKMYLMHYADNWEEQDINDFAGWAEQGAIYNVQKGE